MDELSRESPQRELDDALLPVGQAPGEGSSKGAGVPGASSDLPLSTASVFVPSEAVL